MTEETTPAQLPALHAEPTTTLAVDSGLFGSLAAFETGQRMAKALSSSTLVPAEYQNNLANCMIALEYAQRAKMNVLAVVQNLNVIHGRPSWSSQFIAAAIASSGLFAPLRFEWRGTENSDDWACRAISKDLRTGDRLEGTWVGIKLAKDEGWYARSGSKWKTMPQQMMQYRATAFFGRIYASHILLGMPTADEVEDFIDVTPAPLARAAATVTADQITERSQQETKRARRKASAEDADVIPAQAVPKEPPPAEPASVTGLTQPEVGTEDPAPAPPVAPKRDFF
jgi:hypothetical protein